MKRLERQEASSRLKAQARKERRRALAAEAAEQEGVLASYHALLEGDDPQLAASLAWTAGGHLVSKPPPADAAFVRTGLAGTGAGLAPTAGASVRLLQWD